MEPDSTLLLALTAAATGCLHTLLGPDHYVPIVALARWRRWSLRRSLAWTAALGLLHCLATAALLLAIGGAAAAWSGWRGDLAGGLLLGMGLLLIASAWRRRRRLEVAQPAREPWSAMLSIVFVLGPCEWLAPAMMAARGAEGAAGMAAVVAAFTTATVLTMLVTVAAGCWVGGTLAPRSTVVFGRPGLAAGLAIAASGTLVLAGA